MGKFQGKERENGLKVALGNSYSNSRLSDTSFERKKLSPLEKILRRKQNPQETIRFPSEIKGKEAFVE